MLNFLDLSKSELVDEYIRRNTHIDENTMEKNGWTTQKDGKGMLRIISTAYATVRNTDSQAFEWSYHIDKSDISEIQEACAKPMKTLGYKTMENISTNIFNENYVLMGSMSKEML